MKYSQLTDLGLIQVEGPDACHFLQGQLSCDVENLPINGSRFGRFLQS